MATFHLSRGAALLTTFHRMQASGGAFRLNFLRISSTVHADIPVRAASQISEASTDVVPSQQRPGETFLDKQNRLGRPMAPWMNYQWQITNSMSIANRITGAAMGGAVAIIAIATMVGPYNFVDYFEIVRSWQVPAPVIYTLKLAAAYTFAFHFFNSLRHIAWDLGKGFDLSSTYKSGYSALIAAAIVSVGLAFFLRPEYQKPALLAPTKK